MLAALVGLVALGLYPALADAQASGSVGVVTTLNGQATVSRASLPQPLPLKFKDNVFERDRIRTGEKSIVRVLLGGKAVITVRELSELTITEERNRSTVDLASGKVAMGVLRSRMKPGESIEVRTPNAIAAVRGTVFVVEIIRASASSHGGPVPPTTNVHVIRGRVEVLDPANPGAVLASVGAMESFGRTGTAPGQRRALTPAAVATIFADLTTTPQHTADDLTQEMGQREHARAVALARALTLELNGGSGSGGSGSSGGSTDGRIAGDPDEDFAICGGGTCQVGGGGSGSSGGPTKSGRALTTFINQTVNVGGNFYQVPNASTVTLTQPLLETTATTLNVTQSLVDVQGTLNASDGQSPFIFLDPTSTSVASLLRLSAGGAATFAGTFLADVGGDVTVAGNALDVTGNSTVTGSGASAFLLFDGTGKQAPKDSLDAAGSVLRVAGANSTFTLSGGGALLEETSGAVVKADQLANVNAGLLDASGPLLRLLGGSAFTSAQDAVDLAGVNAATRFKQLAWLDSGIFTVTAGAALRVTGNGAVTVTGDLFTLGNSSQLILLNGVLASLVGNGALTITGSLFNFLGTGNKVTVNNSVCGGPCQMIGGIPVLISGGGSINVNNPVKNLTGNTITYSSPSTALLTVNGKGTITVQGK